MAEWNREWTSRKWRRDVDAWISMVLGSYDLKQTGPAEQGRVRLVSIRLTIPTDHGTLFFKANNPGQQAEASVTATAAKLAPEQLVMPLAIEPRRGWMISPDYGQTLAAVPGADPEVWERMVRDFAIVQQELIPFGDTLFDAGLLQMDPVWLPDYVDGQIMLHASMPKDHPLHLPARDAEELDRGLHPVREACDQLSAGPVPLSLDHGNLQRSAAFLPTRSGEPLRFTGLASAFWAHPFCALAAPLSEMCKELRTGTDDPRVGAVVDAYLEQWDGFGSVRELRPLVEPALRIGRLQTHGTWMRVLTGASDADVEQFAPRALKPLSELVQPFSG